MGVQQCVDFGQDQKTITLNVAQSDTGVSSNKFTFDRVFDMASTQKEVYDIAAKPIIDSVLEGFNGTIFAYGQTSSGKTHTMQGPDIENLEMQGIIPRMVRTVFNRIETANENIEFTVKLSMIEIYMEKIKDLLDPSKDNLKIHEDKQKGVYIDNVTETYVSEELEVQDIMKLGNSNRSISATLMNAESSRSHSIFILTVTQNNLEDLSCKTGKLYLVDLAGSEKIAKTGAVGQTLDEAKTINKSLTTLGKVITALTDKKSSHVPYRESKLTRILQESLGGNSRTCLIITCSPHPYNDAETLSTLRFGQRARNIKNQAKMNREFTVPELKRLLEKTEGDLDIQRCKVKALEGIIMELGGALPNSEEMAEIAARQREEMDRMTEQLNKQEELNSGSGGGLEETKDDSNQIFEESKDQEDPSLTQSSQQIQDYIQQLQDKQDQIEILESTLQKEREKLHQFEIQVADINEEYTIQVGKYNQILHEKDVLAQKNKDYIYKMQQLNDTLQDKDEKIDQLSSKVEIMSSENTQIKESYDKLMAKLQFIQENHILIPKDGKRQAMEESPKVSASDEDYLNNLQDEVRKLHFQVKNKESLIEKLKIALLDQQLNGDNYDENEDNSPQLAMKRIHSLLQKDEKIEATNRQYEQEILKLLTNQNDKLLLNEEFLDTKVHHGILLTVKDLKQVFNTQNSFRQTLLDNEVKFKQLLDDQEKLKNDLKSQLEIEMPNIQEITSKIVKEKVDEVTKKYEFREEQMIRDLQNRVEKVLRLEMELDEVKDAYRALESSLSRDEQQYKQRALKLERSLEQITQMYQQVINEKSILKVDMQVSDKKLQRKEEKITVIEKSLQISREKQQQLQQIVQHLRNEFLKIQQQQAQYMGQIGGNAGSYDQENGFKGVNKIVKPIRGGGGKRLVTPRSNNQPNSLMQSQQNIVAYETLKDRQNRQQQQQQQQQNILNTRQI
eukprot:403350261